MSSAGQQLGNSRSETPVSEPAMRSNYVRYLASLLLLAGIYFAAAKLGLSLASVHTNVSPVWPPTGIALAAVLLLGYRVWPGIFLGAFLANLLTPVPILSVGFIAVGNTLEALSAAYVLNTLGFRKSLGQASDVLKFMVVATLCTMVAATIGTLSLSIGQAARWSDFGSLWVTWWLGDLTGALTLTPLLLTWSAGSGHWLPKRRYLEATALVVLLSLAAIVTFGTSSPAPVHYYPLTLLIVPFLLWAAFRLGRRGVTVAVVVISAFAIWGTSHGWGPFISGTANESLLMLHLFIATNAVTFLFLVTVVEERRLAEATRRENERRLQANLAVTQILAESPETSDALRRILPTVGQSLNWEAGCMWMPDADGKVLRCLAFWQAAAKAPRFEAISRELTFAPGVGLPGQVWASLKPVWIRDVTKDDKFLRAPIATTEGLHAAFAFPILFNEKFLGVIEFVSYETRQSDASLLEMFESIGKQIGQFMERRRAEEALAGAAAALRENEERLRLATTTGKAGVWDWDIIGNRVSWTDSLYEIHGLTKEQFDGTVDGFAAVIHPEDRERVAKAIEESMHGDVPYQLEMRALRPDGETVWIFTNATVLRENGKPVRMLGATLDISELKRVENALRESEERYRSVIQALPAAVYTTDAEGRITMFNDAAVELSGRVPEIGTDSWCVTWKLYHPDGTPMPHAECPMAMALDQGKPIRGYEAIAERPDGTRVSFVPYPTPLHDSSGKLVGAINMLMDISDRKQIEEILRRNERELSEFFENASEAIHWVGPDGTILRANRAELRMLGFSADEYIGRNISDFHVDQETICDILTRLKRGETLEGYAARIRCKDGSTREVLINSSVYFENGEFIHTRCFTRDITKQLEAEKGLRHLAAIVESTEDAIISKNLNGIITSWNPAAERLYGYRPDEIIGRPISDLMPPERRDEEHAILDKLREGERIEHFETIRVAKDGRRLHVSLTVSPIRDLNGNVVGASKIARDISEQRRVSAEREALLARERAAREEAEVASRTKDEFLAVLSHELRTPLTAMLGWISILRGHKLDKKTTAHAIETIERNAKAQAQLIEDLVDVSRIVGGKLNLQVEPIELLPVIDGAIEVVRPAANAKNIEIDMNYDSTVGPVMGDAARLQQVIWNLLSNAIKFTPKGGSVLIDFRRAGSSAEVLIRDTGIGISADFLPHVFERFRQAESPVIRSHRGMGLGLAIVRHLIELHGGTITAESEGENRGAEFTIRIPLAATTVSSVTEIVSHQRDGNGDALKGVRILLVEDEPDARELIALVLRGSGAHVEAVDTVGDALQRLPLFIPDVLLSDIGLPLESGYDLIRQVRALSSEINQVPAIALTAFATESDRKMSLSAGFQAHLAKPVEPSDLVKTIKGLINGKS